MAESEQNLNPENLMPVSEHNLNPENATPWTPPLVGKYSFVGLEENDNVENYLLALGVCDVIRKVHRVALPVLEITCSEDNQSWVIRTETRFHKNFLRGKIGQEVDYETFDVRPSKAIFEVNESGTRLILRQKCDEGPDVETVYEKTDDYTITMTLVSAGNQAVQIFRAPKIRVEDAEEEVD